MQATRSLGLCFLMFASLFSGCTAVEETEEVKEVAILPELVFDPPLKTRDLNFGAQREVLIKGHIDGVDVTTLGVLPSIRASITSSTTPDGEDWVSVAASDKEVMDDLTWEALVTTSPFEFTMPMLPPGEHVMLVVLSIPGQNLVKTDITLHIDEGKAIPPTLTGLDQIEFENEEEALGILEIEHPLLFTCEVGADDDEGERVAANLDLRRRDIAVYPNTIDANSTVSVWAECGMAVTGDSTQMISFIRTDTTMDEEVEIDAEIDSDVDGIIDLDDECPEGVRGWTSGPTTDYDGDGCHDVYEDKDDDNDTIPDDGDSCPRSEQNHLASGDHDRDGCANSNDADDDEDWLNDEEDACPYSPMDPEREDLDEDGCMDDEDGDDDGDGFADETDACPRSPPGLAAGSLSDADRDGCADENEDLDDDDDGVLDESDVCPGTEAGGEVNDRGCTDSDDDGIPEDQDTCPNTPSDEVGEIDGHGCGPSQRDGDADGLTDDMDECPNTPAGYAVDARGCEDVDGDGIPVDSDQCPSTPAGLAVDERGCGDVDADGIPEDVDTCQDTIVSWTSDAQGCAANQWSISWNSSGPYTADRLGRAGDFTVSTLDGQWRLASEWTGNETYLFIFNQQSSSYMSSLWAQSPRQLLLNLPSNGHIFFGSYDSTADADVRAMRTRVSNAMTAYELTELNGRIHYINTPGFQATGSLGDVIQDWSQYYYGIDRYQQWREIGSLYNWARATSSEPQYRFDYISMEARTWNYEFETQQRTQDLGVFTFPLTQSGQWHIGGWGGGHTSKWNVTWPNATTLAAYDTLEIYAYNPCSEHRNRYGIDDDGDGQTDRYGGCHEWDYLAYLDICTDAWNGSTCNEFVRYITTYGREGRWLTDISELMFLIDPGQQMGMRYRGANGYGLDIIAIFSDHPLKSHVPTAGEKLFTGGRFDQDYNNASKYVRIKDILVPASSTRIDLYSVVTGHGFGRDAANCAEFCNHEHRFTFPSGWSITEDHPTAGNSTVNSDREGCKNLADEGTVANQLGSWPFGRAGWCPGQDVAPWTWNVTSQIAPGQNISIRYDGLYDGQTYVPNYVGDGTWPDIRMESWLIFSEPHNASMTNSSSSKVSGRSSQPQVMGNATPTHICASQSHPSVLALLERKKSEGEGTSSLQT